MENTNSLFDLIIYQPDIENIYLYVYLFKYEEKYQFLIKQRGKCRLKTFNWFWRFFLNTWIIWMVFMKILKNTIEIRNAKYWLHLTIWLLTFLVIKKKHNPTVTELFIRGRKSNISLVYITQSSFALAKKKC